MFRVEVSSSGVGHLPLDLRLLHQLLLGELLMQNLLALKVLKVLNESLLLLQLVLLHLENLLLRLVPMFVRVSDKRRPRPSDLRDDIRTGFIRSGRLATGVSMVTASFSSRL